MGQRERIEKVLRERGYVAATDFMAPNVIDGGKPITRVAARMLELRAAGYELERERAKNGTAIYRLIKAPLAAAGGNHTPHPHTVALPPQGDGTDGKEAGSADVDSDDSQPPTDPDDGGGQLVRLFDLPPVEPVSAIYQEAA